MASSRKSSVDEEVINHYGAARIHVKGNGNFRLTLLSLDDFKVFPMLSLVLAQKGNIELTRLANFTQQKARLEMRTTEIDETFNINKVVVFVRPVAKSYPGQ